MSMLDTYKNITTRIDGVSPISGFTFSLMEDCENDYHKEQLATVPKGTLIVGDFAGDFGIYAMAEVNGEIHRIKICTHELHKINFGPFDARFSDSAPD